MKDLKELLFVAISSAIIILGLGFLNVFGIKLAYVPLLLSAVAIGILIHKEITKPSITMVIIAALAGLVGAIMIQSEPSMAQLGSLALGFAISLALPFILIEIRKGLVEKKAKA